MEEDHDPVPGQVAVRLDVQGPGGMSLGDGREGVLGDTVLGGDVRDESAMGQHSRRRRGGEPRMRHDAEGPSGCDAARGAASRTAASSSVPEKAPETFFRASVNSLGMIHSLLAEPSLILGSVCRYW
jgi:hypothetical protein